MEPRTLFGQYGYIRIRRFDGDFIVNSVPNTRIDVQPARSILITESSRSREGKRRAVTFKCPLIDAVFCDDDSDVSGNEMYCDRALNAETCTGAKEFANQQLNKANHRLAKMQVGEKLLTRVSYICSSKIPTQQEVDPKKRLTSDPRPANEPLPADRIPRPVSKSSPMLPSNEDPKPKKPYITRSGRNVRIKKVFEL